MVYRKVLVFVCAVTGVLSAVALLPGPIVIGLFLGLLPGLILIVSPYVFLISSVLLVGDVLFCRLRPAARIMSHVVLVGVLVTLDTAFAYWMNGPLERHWNELVQDDRTMSDPGALLGVRHVAIIDRDRKTVNCFSICQRLLYNGSVDTVSVGPIDWSRHRPVRTGETGQDDAPVDLNEAVVSFHIEKRRECPPVDLPDESMFSQHIGDAFRTRVALDMKARMAGGECLISAPSTLASSDLILVQQEVADGHIPFMSERWDFQPNSLQAKRLTAYRIRPADVPLVIFRRTDLTAYFLVTPLLISTVSGAYVDLEIGLARETRSTVKDFWGTNPVWSFLAADRTFNLEPVAP